MAKKRNDRFFPVALTLEKVVGRRPRKLQSQRSTAWDNNACPTIILNSTMWGLS